MGNAGSIAANVSGSRASTREVSLLYLYLMRAAYLLLVIGLATSVWPALLAHTTWPLTLGRWRSVGNSMIAALPVLGPAFFLVIPWRYVFANFVQQAGDRWK